MAHAAPSHAAPRDRFFWLTQINRASAVMIVERGIVPKPLGAKIFDAINRVDAAGDAPGAARSGDYLNVEHDLVAAGGPDITRLHSGRSRQDIGATTQRLIMRDDFLAAFDKLNGMREAMLALAAQAPDAIIPAYTWGVQAQPITLGHYLSGYANSFAREAARMREAFVRLNQSPLGAAALGTSSFPIDRIRLAELLGFDAPVENSYDANQISPIDGGADCRHHDAICPDRTLDLARRGRTDRRQQHHAAKAQSDRTGAAARRGQHPDRRSHDVCLHCP